MRYSEERYRQLFELESDALVLACDDTREILSTGVPKLQYEETIQQPNGSPRIMRSSKVPLRDRSGRVFGVLGVHEDITDRTAVRAALREREDLLRQSQKMEAIGRLAGGIAHDFSNVLTTIIGYADLVLAATGPSRTVIEEDAKEIRAAAARAVAQHSPQQDRAAPRAHHRRRHRPEVRYWCSTTTPPSVW